MDKHKNGKNLRVKAHHNAIEFYLCVVKGKSPDHVPNNELEADEVHFSIARSKKEFDDNIIEVLNEVATGVEVICLCTSDVVYEYAYSRAKELSVN